MDQSFIGPKGYIATLVEQYRFGFLTLLSIQILIPYIHEKKLVYFNRKKTIEMKGRDKVSQFFFRLIFIS
jgi:uncharacterized protein YbgA (DUF1722 family)